MAFISLDTSTKKTGYAVYSDTGELLTSGVVTNSSDDYIVRANFMADFLGELSQIYGATHLCIEELKVLKNQKTLTMLAITQGIILRELSHLPVQFVAPNVWRSLFKIPNKRADAKKKAISLVERNLGKTVTDDEAEAILIGRFFFKKCLHK